MTGQDFQDKLDAIVLDLKTAGRGGTVEISLRSPTNAVNEFALSSNAEGVVNATQLAEIQTAVNNLKPIADEYEIERAPVQAALEEFNARRATHQAVIDAASAARQTMQDELEADETYQNLKTTLDTARADADYIAAVENYRVSNVSENFGNLGDAKGKYVQ